MTKLQRAAYPLYQDLIGDRTANRQAAIAADGLIRVLLPVALISRRLESLIAEDAPKLAGELVVDLSGEMIENLETLDLTFTSGTFHATHGRRLFSRRDRPSDQGRRRPPQRVAGKYGQSVISPASTANLQKSYLPRHKVDQEG